MLRYYAITLVIMLSVVMVIIMIITMMQLIHHGWVHFSRFVPRLNLNLFWLLQAVQLFKVCSKLIMGAGISQGVCLAPAKFADFKHVYMYWYLTEPDVEQTTPCTCSCVFVM